MAAHRNLKSSASSSSRCLELPSLPDLLLRCCRVSEQHYLPICNSRDSKNMAAGTKRVLDEASGNPRAKKTRTEDKSKKSKDKTTQPASTLVVDDVDFPRGGGTTLTPLEVKTLRAEAAKEADKELFAVRAAYARQGPADRESLWSGVFKYEERQEEAEVGGTWYPHRCGEGWQEKGWNTDRASQLQGVSHVRSMNHQLTLHSESCGRHEDPWPSGCSGTSCPHRVPPKPALWSCPYHGNLYATHSCSRTHRRLSDGFVR